MEFLYGGYSVGMTSSHFENTCDYTLESSTLQCPDDPSGPPALPTLGISIT